MPKRVEKCVESVLEDNPEYSESRAWAICKAQQEAETEDVVVRALSETPVFAPELDQLTEESGEWVCQERDGTVAWIGTADGVAVFEEADQFAADVYRITQPGTEGPATAGALLGLAVDLPNAGVIVDWNIDAWPDDEQLSGPHVSDYDTLEDLRQVTAGELDLLKTVGAATAASADDDPDGGADEADETAGDEADDTDATQQVLVDGLTAEAQADIERRYNATVQEVNSDE